MKERIWVRSCRKTWKEPVLLFILIPIQHNNLFFRSDNATLARLGCSGTYHLYFKNGNPPEPNYHKASDEIGTLDMENMAMIIKSIASVQKEL
jgi:hypothetical protein